MWWLLPLTLAAAPLGFDEALARADVAPELAAGERALALRQEGLARLPRLTTNPTVTLQPGVRSTDGVAGPEGQVTLSQAFNLGGLAGARRAVAEAELQAARQGHALSRRERRVAVAHAWLEAWAAQAAGRAAHAEVERARALAATLDRLVDGGSVTRADAAAARAFAAEAAAFALEWEGRQVEAGAALALLLGEGALLTVSDALPSLEVPEVDAALAPRLPAVRLLDAQALAEQQRAAEVAAQWASQLQVSIQGGHETPGQWLGNVGLGLTLPLFERGEREASHHRAEAARLAGALSQATAQARVQLLLLAHELEHTAEVHRVVHDEQLPAAAEAARLEQRRFEQGETTLGALLLVRRQALQAEVAAAQTRAAMLAARVEAREVLASGALR